jgi:hypothetical protein
MGFAVDAMGLRPLFLARIAFYSFSFAISFLIAAALCMT